MQKASYFKPKLVLRLLRLQNVFYVFETTVHLRLCIWKKSFAV